jgi:sec-independent protein translocase protein TatA
MFGISGEHILILGIILLIFGPRRLPELGNTLGKAIKNFKDSVAGVEEAQYRKIDDAPKTSLNDNKEASAPKA